MKRASVVTMWGLALCGAGSMVFDAASTTPCVDKAPRAGMIDHNAGRSTGYPYYVGENTYAAGGSTINPAQAVGLWASEVSQYTNLQYGASLVCNYAPGGNVDGQRPY